MHLEVTDSKNQDITTYLQVYIELKELDILKKKKKKVFIYFTKNNLFPPSLGTSLSQSDTNM